jgi:hypothetical protein
LERGLVSDNQTVRRRKFQSPKSDSAIRRFALSSRLLAHVADYLKQWEPNEKGLIFATRQGTPWVPTC